MTKLRPPQPDNDGQVRGLNFGFRSGVGAAVTPPTVAVEGKEDVSRRCHIGVATLMLWRCLSVERERDESAPH